MPLVRLRQGVGQVSLRPPLNADRLPWIDISLQPIGAVFHSGQSLLRGANPLLPEGARPVGDGRCVGFHGAGLCGWTAGPVRGTLRRVLGPGDARSRTARTLNAAYVEGLLSEDTLVQRLDQLFGARLIDRFRLTGDLNFRRSQRRLTTIADTLRATIARIAAADAETDRDPILLGLDWEGGLTELIVGRDPGCDVVLDGPEVSRRHARLFFRDGKWVLQDLSSTNGTTVNGVRVGRCELRPGDRLGIADEVVEID